MLKKIDYLQIGLINIYINIKDIGSYDNNKIKTETDFMEEIRNYELYNTKLKILTKR